MRTVSARADGRDHCGRYPSHPDFGKAQCSIGGGGGTLFTAPTGGSTQVIEDTGKRLKLKKIPKLPDMGKLSDVAIILLVLKTLDNFAPAFPPDGFGITEYHANEQPSGRGYVLMDNIQFDAYKAANKFADVIFPILIAISTRPSITAMQGQNAAGAKEDVMKFVYVYSGGGIPGKRYLNTKYVFDFLNGQFGKLRDGIKQVEKNVAAFETARQEYNAQQNINAQTLAMWSDAQSTEYAAIESILALSKDSKSIMDTVAAAVVAVGRQKASEKIDEAVKSTQDSIKNFFKLGSKAAPQIDKQSSLYRKALGRFQVAFAFSAPPGGGTTKTIPTAMAGMKGLSAMNFDFNTVLKFGGIALLAFGVMKKNKVMMGAGVAAAGLGWYRGRQTYSAPPVQQNTGPVANPVQRALLNLNAQRRPGAKINPIVLYTMLKNAQN